MRRFKEDDIVYVTLPTEESVIGRVYRSQSKGDAVVLCAVNFKEGVRLKIVDVDNLKILRKRKPVYITGFKWAAILLLVETLLASIQKMVVCSLKGDAPASTVVIVSIYALIGTFFVCKGIWDLLTTLRNKKILERKEEWQRDF